MDARPVTGSELHAADERGVGWIDEHELHRPAHADPRQRLAESRMREGCQHPRALLTDDGLQFRTFAPEVQLFGRDRHVQPVSELRDFRGRLADHVQPLRARLSVGDKVDAARHHRPARGVVKRGERIAGSIDQRQRDMVGVEIDAEAAAGEVYDRRIGEVLA